MTDRYVAQKSTRGPRVKDRETGEFVFFRTYEEAESEAAILNGGCPHTFKDGARCLKPEVGHKGRHLRPFN